MLLTLFKSSVTNYTMVAAAVPTYEPIAAFESGPVEPERVRLYLHSDGFFYGVSRGGGAVRMGTRRFSGCAMAAIIDACRRRRHSQAKVLYWSVWLGHSVHRH